MSNERQRAETMPVTDRRFLATDGEKEIRSSRFRRFGWTIEEMQLPGGTCGMLKLGERLVGGILQMPSGNEGPPIAWMPCITVANLGDAVARSTLLGAKLCREVMPVQGLGSLAIITNPQGAMLGLWEFTVK